MYTFGSRVRYSETDEYGRLTLTGIMNYLQDCSTFQSEDNGLGISYLTGCHKAWWLSSWQIVVDRYPVLGEEIEISTWPYDLKGFYGYRNFTICDKAGEYLVRANSVWFLFDTEKGRPVKIRPEDIRGYGFGREEQLEMDYAPRKIGMSAVYDTKEPVMIGKHHIDTNHHVNNAKYVEIAREVLPDEVEVTELRVEYKKAAVFGDAVYPCVSRTEEGYTVSLCDEQGAAYAVIWLRGTTERI
ncbi:acyl-[acyl-carrier-protein] thioesterase [Clostridium sp. Marseille-P2415]|uniref:acyl-[acyl-carrier-protein] thioesterase n=1 Tax=Clostridium sp. Marseille-P2415 TaxID=1805471 RepID=UPI00098833EA|nr:acyl-ACP thioesterase domain-containing protein [Clostridium sp. Marseille-P2415]